MRCGADTSQAMTMTEMTPVDPPQRRRDASRLPRTGAYVGCIWVPLVIAGVGITIAVAVLVFWIIGAGSSH
jgi:hypothetical protein